MNHHDRSPEVAVRSRRLPPPLWALVGVLVQWWLDDTTRISDWSSIGGGLIALAAVAVGVWAAAMFRKHHTTVDPLTPGKASELVVEGPFGFTRNPMYVAMAGVLVAVAVVLQSPLALLPVAAFVLLMSETQIEAEEAVMREKFGEQWAEYVRRVPRWVGHRSLHPGQCARSTQ